ncbi:MAG: hypothetical protein ACYC2Y_07990 [Armatimonadota bacterium]
MSEPLSPEERDELVDELARKIVNRRMETPAVLFLEMNKPLAFLAGQSIFVASPLLSPLFGPQGVRKYAQLFSEENSIERLIRRIEELSAERDKEKDGTR